MKSDLKLINVWKTCLQPKQYSIKSLLRPSSDANTHVITYSPVSKPSAPNDSLKFRKDPQRTLTPAAELALVNDSTLVINRE